MTREDPRARELRDKTVGTLAVGRWGDASLGRIAAVLAAEAARSAATFGESAVQALARAPRGELRAAIVRALAECRWPNWALQRIARAVLDEFDRGVAPDEARGAALSLARALSAGAFLAATALESKA